MQRCAPVGVGTIASCSTTVDGTGGRAGLWVPLKHWRRGGRDRGGGRDDDPEHGESTRVVEDAAVAIQPIEIVVSEAPVVDAMAKDVPRGDQNGVADGHDGAPVTRRPARRRYCAAR